MLRLELIHICVCLFVHITAQFVVSKKDRNSVVDDVAPTISQVSNGYIHFGAAILEGESWLYKEHKQQTCQNTSIDYSYIYIGVIKQLSLGNSL